MSLVAGTQYFAWTVGRNRLPNELFKYAGIRIYSPIEILEWLRLWKSSRRSMEDFRDSLILMGGCAFMGVALIEISVRDRNEKHDAGNLYGSAQYAELEEIREAGLLPPKGEKGKGVYVGGWINPKDGQQYYLRHNGKEHVIALAPTRSGKGVGLVIPTLLSWEHSVVVLEPVQYLFENQ